MKQKHLNNNTILILFLFLATLCLGVGYASISSVSLSIDGTALATPQDEVFITDVVYTSNVGADITQSKIKDFTATVLNSKVVLSSSNSNSSITYTVSMYNSNNYDVIFTGAVYDSNFYDNENIIFNLSNITEGEILSSNQTKTFTITFTYKEGITPSNTNNTLESYINFSFKKNHTITYNGITTDATTPLNIGEGTTYNYTFPTPPEDVSVTMGATELIKGTDFTYSSGTLNIPNVTEDLIITKVDTNPPAMEYILDQTENSNEYKGDIVEGSTYSGVSTSNDSGLYSIIDPNTGTSESMYFYRGNVTDNYFSFANKTWRILRINSDGSLRLILDGSAGTSRYQSRNTPTSNTIDNAISLLNWENSTVYSTLNTWYNNNLSSFDDYIIQNSEYVFDTSYQEKTSSANSNLAVYYFGSYLRVGRDGALYQPTYSYTEDSIVRDKIGLLSADEVLYAGGFWQTNNTSYFLYNSSITTDWWTISPSFWDKQSHYKAGMLVIGSSGQIHDWPSNGNTLTATLAIRPVITVRGDLEITGTGTSSNPYRFTN